MSRNLAVKLLAALLIGMYGCVAMLLAPILAEKFFPELGPLSTKIQLLEAILLLIALLFGIFIVIGLFAYYYSKLKNEYNESIKINRMLAMDLQKRDIEINQLESKLEAEEHRRKKS